MNEEIPTVEPRKYAYIDFADCVEGIVLSSALINEGRDRKILIEVDERILNELIVTKRLKPEEIIQSNRIYVTIPDVYCDDKFYLASNPRITADCDFRGNPISGKTSNIKKLLAMERENNHILNLQVLELERKLQMATSDIARFIKENRETFRPIIEQIKEERPTVMPMGMKIRRTKPE